jgi:hypothetical protein
MKIFVVLKENNKKNVKSMRTYLNYHLNDNVLQTFD